MRAWLVVTALYLLGALVFLWPLPLHLGTHVWGDRFDAWTTLWLIDHLHRHLAAGTLAAHTTEILFPAGYNLWSFGHAALQALGVGLRLLGVPLVAAYNLLLVFALTTSALAAHGLGHALARDHRGGVVAGVTFATSPYLYGEGAAGCIELVAAGLIPLYLLALVHLTRHPGWRAALLATLALAVIGPFNWYYTLFAGMLGLGFAAWQWLAGHRRAVAWMVGAMVTAAALNAPLVPLVRRETPTRPPLALEQFVDRSAWLRSTAILDGSVPLGQLDEAGLEEHDAVEVFRNSTSLASLAAARFTLNPLESTPGALAFSVGLAGLFAGRRRAWGWAALAGGATLLTLGPFLSPDGTVPIPDWSAELPLPYWFGYQHVPFFSKAYRPYRIGVDALVALSALGAVGVAAMLAEGRSRAVTAAAAGLYLVGMTQPFWSGDRPGRRPLADAAIPAAYTELAALPRGGVIELPLQYQPITNANARFQYHQVAHRQPLLNCNQLIRRTDLLAFRDYVLGNGLLSLFLDLGRRAPPYRYDGADLAALVADGFRYVVLHTRVPADEGYLAGDVGASDRLGMVAMRLLRESFGAPVIARDGVEVFVLPERVEAGLREWTGGEVAPLALPVDAERVDLPMRLGPGQVLPLFRGEARRLGLWVRPVDGAAMEVEVRGAGGARRVAVDSAAAHWSWVEVDLEGLGPVAVELRAVADTGARFAVSGAEVMR